MSTLWPDIDSGYVDSEGFIALEVYLAAGELWPESGRVAAAQLHDDEELALRLMLRAAANVTKRHLGGGEPIRDLKGYLNTAFRHLVAEEQMRIDRVLQREVEWLTESVRQSAVSRTPNAYDPVLDIERSLLVMQIVDRMNPWMRGVFQCLVLDHTYEEIAKDEKMNPERMKADNLRSRFHRNWKQLKRTIEECEAGAAVRVELYRNREASVIDELTHIH